MRSLATLLLAVLATAVALPARAQQLEGTWRLTHIADRPLPAVSPGEESVMLHDVELVFQADGRFTFKLSASSRHDPAPGSRRVSGTYTVEGDTLVMVRTDEDGGDTETVRFSLRDGRLILYEDDSEYAFARQ